MTNIDEQFVEFVVKSLVSKPEAVQVERRIDEKGVLLELTVDPEDLGRVIGKRGATAQSLRTLLRALGTKNDARYNLKIVDNGDPDHGHHAHNQADEPASSGAATADDVTTDDATSRTATEPADETVEETTTDEITDEEPLPPAATEPETSDRLSQTRKELEEFDDLDV